jgi:hypothetical protein
MLGRRRHRFELQLDDGRIGLNYSRTMVAGWWTAGVKDPVGDGND